jgi:RNA polymerase sigma factor (sigma-70 family)
MQPADDHVCLRKYVESQSDEAFAALVTRHVNLVYSVARRQTGNPHDAEEITQAVFIILARKAGQLRQERALSSWLFQTTRLITTNFVRGNVRRRHREEEASMQSVSDELKSDAWPKVAPLLDTAVAGLREKDRQAIILRYYEGRNLREIGVALGASEDAAEKRVSRALDKLRKFFARRGVTSPAVVLSAAMAANSVHAAPAGLANTVTALALAKGATAGVSTLTLIKGALKLMAWTKVKTAVAMGAAVILAAGTTATLVLPHQHQPKPQPMPAGLTDYPRDSWVFAGYADPQSALMSYLWASVCQSNRQVFERSLTPAEDRLYRQMIGMNRQVPQLHSAAATVAETFQRANEEWQNGSYRILDQKTVAADQVVFHLEAQRAREKMEVYISTRKLGTEWKYDGIQRRKIFAATAPP